MDPAEIPHRLDPLPDSPPFAAGNRLRRSAMPFDPVCKVLDDDNLLIEILLLIGYPTTLVRAALVCKRWYCHASDPAFLIRFRKLHPPRLLGFYVNPGLTWKSHRFVPMLPHPPEFDDIISRACVSLDAIYRTPQSSNTSKFVFDCQNGNVFIKTFKRYGEETGSTRMVLSPLCPGRGMVNIPRFPWPKPQDDNFFIFSKLLFKKEGEALSYFYVLIESSKERTKTVVHVYVLQDGVWCVYASATTQLPFRRRQKLNTLLVGNKIYMAATPSEILVLDLTALSFSTFELPQGLVISSRLTMLSRADDDSGVYLIHLNELQLCIWLHTGDNWLLVDTICLREMFAKLKISARTYEVSINQAGDNAEFVFFEMGTCLLYLSIKCRMMCKVYEMKNETEWFGRIHPFMMIWPPTFPALKDMMILQVTPHEDEEGLGTQKSELHFLASSCVAKNK